MGRFCNFLVPPGKGFVLCWFFVVVLFFHTGRSYKVSIVVQARCDSSTVRTKLWCWLMIVNQGIPFSKNLGKAGVTAGLSTSIQASDILIQLSSNGSG